MREHDEDLEAVGPGNGNSIVRLGVTNCARPDDEGAGGNGYPEKPGRVTRRASTSRINLKRRVGEASAGGIHNPAADAADTWGVLPSNA